MRGIAAFIVYIRHFSAIHHPNIQYGYGANEDNNYWIQLPFFRLFISGPSMVAVFFIISGYALTWGPLNALHNSSSDQALSRLSSAISRRAVRLFLPGLVSTFLIMMCISFGLYDRGQRAFESDIEVPGFKEPQPPLLRDQTVMTHFWDWVWCSWEWLNVWGIQGHAYNPHLWTLSTEFRCSIELFVMIIGIVRMKIRWRMAGLFGAVMYAYWTNMWAEFLFFSGGFLAQIRLVQRESIQREEKTVHLEDGSDGLDPLDPLTETSGEGSTSGRDVVRCTIFVLGLYLLSTPDGGFGKF
jgi:peptidoglycan/LPS O-acetylase OafA/YrhL